LAAAGELRETLRRAALREPRRRFHQLYDKLYRRDVLDLAFERACARGGRPHAYGRADLEGEGKRLQKGAFRRRGTFGDRVVEEALALVLEPVLLPRRNFAAWDVLITLRNLLVNSGGPVATFRVRPEWTTRPGTLLDLLELRIADRKVTALVRAFLAAPLSAAVLDYGPLHVPRLAPGLGPLLAEYQLVCWERSVAAFLPGRVVRAGNEAVVVGGCPPAFQAGGGIVVAEERLVDPLVADFDFLGFSWRRRPRTGETIFQPGREGIRAVRARIRETTRGQTHLDLAAMVERVNRLLFEWGGYYRVCPGRKAMKKIDAYVRERLAIFNARKHGRSGFGMGQPAVSRAALRELGLIELGRLPPVEQV